jgi:hypothetical protein
MLSKLSTFLKFKPNYRQTINVWIIDKRIKTNVFGKDSYLISVRDENGQYFEIKTDLNGYYNC